MPLAIPISRLDSYRGFSPGRNGVAALLASLVTAVLLMMFMTMAVHTFGPSPGRPGLTVFFVPHAEAPPMIPPPAPVAAHPDPAPVAVARQVAVPERADTGRQLFERADPAPAPVTGMAEGGPVRGVGTGAGDARTGGVADAGGGTSGTDTGEGEILPAQWAVIPGDGDLGPHDPYSAKVARISGRVVLTCHVLPSQRLRDCRVVRESPTGYGFALGALAAAKTFLVKPPQRNGVILEQARVAIPVSFINP